MIPEHLAKFEWYKAHQLWLKGEGGCRADLSGAVLSRAVLRGAVLSRAVGVATKQECITRLGEIREHIVEHGDLLDMQMWHGNGWDHSKPPEEHACQTAHCLAGWVQALHPDAFVRAMNPVDAGVKLIPLAAPLFWSDNNTVMEWLRDRKYATE